MINKHHTPILSPNQCASSLTQKINAPLPLVWSLIRQFDNPKTFRLFIKDCTMVSGRNANTGSVRELELISGLPAKSSTERLDRLDDELHVMIVSIIGGNPRLVNYKSTVSLHEIEEENGCNTTVVIESYVVDIPEDSCEEDTCVFLNTMIRLDLTSLARISEKMVIG